MRDIGRCFTGAQKYLCSLSIQQSISRSLSLSPSAILFILLLLLLLTCFWLHLLLRFLLNFFFICSVHSSSSTCKLVDSIKNVLLMFKKNQLEFPNCATLRTRLRVCVSVCLYASAVRCYNLGFRLKRSGYYTKRFQHKLNSLILSDRFWIPNSVCCCCCYSCGDWLRFNISLFFLFDSVSVGRGLMYLKILNAGNDFAEKKTVFFLAPGNWRWRLLCTY